MHFFSGKMSFYCIDKRFGILLITIFFAGYAVVKNGMSFGGFN